MRDGRGDADRMDGWLATVTQGTVLGRMRRLDAAYAAELRRNGEVAEIEWTGRAVKGVLLHPFARVSFAETPEGEVRVHCSHCDAPGLCGHAGAVLLTWLELRPSLLEKGAGTTWRRGALQPFKGPETAEVHDIDLRHQSDPADVVESLRFQLGRQSVGNRGVLRRNGEHLEIRLTPASGAPRVVRIGRDVLPYMLEELRRLPQLELDEELARLRCSHEQQLTPRLRTAVLDDGGLLVQPGYRLGETFMAVEDAERFGFYLRLGDRLHLAYSPPEALAAYFKRGSTRLTGRAAADFLARDHFALFGTPPYEPQGELAAAARLPQPQLAGVEAVGGDGESVTVRPVFTVAGRTVRWTELHALLQTGFGRIGGVLVRAPDLTVFSAAGLKLQARGLRGNRLGFVRAIADARVPVRSKQPELESLAEALLTSPPDLPDPPGLRSVLRPYQRQGAAWLWRLYRTGLGALLADDMGLGKTHQTMALLALVHAEKPDAGLLVVCPRGVLEHWRHLLATFAPALPVVVFHGAQRSLRDAPEGALVLTTYDIAWRSLAALARRTWEVAVFDEAQRTKNPRTRSARGVKAIPAAFRLALTGTPLENSLLDLWSVMDLVVPGYLGSERAFQAAYKSASPAHLEGLRRRLIPFTLRRLKGDVLQDLPAKHEELLYCELTDEQRRIYVEISDAAVAPIARQLADHEAEIPYMHIFALLTRLKQVCDHPGLLDRTLARSRPGKLELLDEILDEALAAGNRVVIFSQYVAMIELLGRHLVARHVPHLVLTGATRNRGEVVARFNTETHEPVMLASLLAGGVGIDLTAASVVVHYDRWWNPAREDQATDRVHRIGQTRYVQVFKLVTSDTVEERIDEILRRKGELAAEVVAPTEQALRSLTREELAELLGLRV